MSKKRRRRRFGSAPETHERNAAYAYEKSRENAERAVEMTDRRTPNCSAAIGALATAEYWRGRGDAEADGAGRGKLFNDAASSISKAYASVSRGCRRDK